MSEAPENEPIDEFDLMVMFADMEDALEKLAEGLKKGADGIAKTGIDPDELSERILAAKDAIADGRFERGMMDDIMLDLSALLGELDRSVHGQVGYIAEHWDKMFPVGTDKEVPEGIAELLVEWRSHERENLLSQLPLEDRRKIEAGENPALPEKPLRPRVKPAASGAKTGKKKPRKRKKE